ncbi:MAG: arylsulfotransferase [Candidatus Altiarchaeota archaeon]|nr:arylsulfotransferase [Candidatus Altiarchaeota archaeon]
MINLPEAYDGYTLFSPIYSNVTYLIDNSGEIIFEWDAKNLPGKMAYLLDNTNLLRTEIFPDFYQEQYFHYGGSGGKLKEFTLDGEVVWEFTYSNKTHLQHHDLEVMPNGNILLIAWEKKTKEEAISAGRNPELISENESEIWPDHLVEIKPIRPNGGEVVWEWHLWDHVIQDFDPTKENYGVVKDHPELVDINYVWEYSLHGNMADWVHLNSVDFNEELDQIIMSSPSFNEVWIIDHSTTSDEAATHTGGKSGKGGDLLYRWGNPRTYRAGDLFDQKLFMQHDVQWIDSGLPGEGNILIYNNGWRRLDENYSSVIEFSIPTKGGEYFLDASGTYGPKDLVWEYFAKNKSSFYSPKISSAQRLPNGNTLIDVGDFGVFFEVTPDKKVVWKYINPYTQLGKTKQGDEISSNKYSQHNAVFMIKKYPLSFFE